MTKAFDRIMAGLQDIRDGRYTIVRPSEESAKPCAKCGGEGEWNAWEDCEHLIICSDCGYHAVDLKGTKAEAMATWNRLESKPEC